MGGGGGGNNDAEKLEEERQAKIAQGMTQINKIFGQYNDDFYNKRATDYEAWALPQVQDQYGKAKDELLYALARQYGTTNTSEAAKRQAELAEKMGLAVTGQKEQGMALANQARGSVEDARTRLIQQLNATADPSAAASGAMQQTALLNQVDPYEALGELFANTTEGLAASTYPYGLMNQPVTGGRKGTGGVSGKSYTVN